MIHQASTLDHLRHGQRSQRPAIAPCAALPFDSVDELRPTSANAGHASFSDLDALDWLRFWLPQSDWRIGPKARQR
jgi:hypothetical protein